MSVVIGGVLGLAVAVTWLSALALWRLPRALDRLHALGAIDASIAEVQALAGERLQKNASLVSAAPPPPVNAMMKATTVETPTAAHATVETNASLRTRRPTSQLIAAPTSGAKTTTESQ